MRRTRFLASMLVLVGPGLVVQYWRQIRQRTRRAGFLSVLAVLCVIWIPSQSAWAQACGPGPHWIDTCPSGNVFAPTASGLIGIDLNDDCMEDSGFNLGGPMTISRSAGVPHTIVPTEIVALSLTDGSAGGVTLTAGQSLTPGGVLLNPSLGQIFELADTTTGDSFFNVFFEVFLPGTGFVYNQIPVTFEAAITQVPPPNDYISPISCTPLFTAPVGGVYSEVNLIRARFSLGDETVSVPALAAPALISLALLMLTGAIIYGIRRPIGGGS